MKELPERIHDDTNSLDYVLVGDYYIPALRLTEESRPIGHWGRRRKAYLEEARPALYCSLLLSGKLWTHLAVTVSSTTPPPLTDWKQPPGSRFPLNSTPRQYSRKKQPPSRTLPVSQPLQKAAMTAW